MTIRFFWLALILFIIAATGTLIWDFGYNGDHDTILGLTTFSIGLTTLFGFMMLSNSRTRDWSLTRGGLRGAIAASIVVTYLFLVGLTTFLETPERVSEVTKSFISSFTGVVGVTIAFYFGASAVVQALGKEETKEKETPPKKDPEK
jgi:hypothetical protein